MKIAANLSAKSGYIIRPGPYCVLTRVNRKANMNTYEAIIAEPDGGTGVPVPSTRAYPGILPDKPAERFSGIRSSGQYCRRPAQIMKDSPMTAPRITRGMMAVHGMCP
jgi:hypothetical protein